MPWAKLEPGAPDAQDWTILPRYEERAMQAPFVILGDGWQNPTGLARIARDLHSVLRQQDLVEPVHIGFHPPAQLVESGRTQRSFGHLGEDWGASSVIGWIAENYDPLAPGVLFIVWDPSRAVHYVRLAKQYLPGWALWGYFAVDGHDARGRIGEPAAEAIRDVDRVLGYTSYGAAILSRVRGKAVDWLPHGIDIQHPPFFDATALARLLPRFARDRDSWMLGCVATNQPRKDLGLFVALLAELRRRGERVYGWLHTDELIKAWSLRNLVEIHAMQKYLRVTTGMLSDGQLRQYYCGCRLTICVGRGEGFGYPIVESLACGTPCLAMNYAGGAELTPPPFRYPWRAMDYTNVYAIGRPLADVEVVANRAQVLLQHPTELLSAYCTGSVAHLQWSALAPRWQEWVKRGMEEL